MKRTLIVFAVLVLCLAFAACANSNTNKISDSADTSESGKVSQSDNNFSKDSGELTAEENAESEDTDLQKKLSSIGAEEYFADYVIPRRYMIVCDSSVLCVQFLDSVEKTIEMPLASISDVKTLNTGEFTVIKITDNSGAELSFNARSEDADIIIQKIRK